MSEPMQSSTMETGPRSTTPQAGLVLESVRTTLDQDPLVLAPGRYHLGSGADCEVRITAAGVAARHCLVVVGPRKTVVKSFSPLTWINDSPVREGTLCPGDRFVVGPIEFAVREPHPDERTQATTVTSPNSGQATETNMPLALADAAARSELEAAAQAAVAETERHRTPPAVRGAGAGLVSPPPPHATQRPHASDTRLRGTTADWDALAESRAALKEQRDYLAQLAGTLEHRERELTARESEIRTRWDELQGERGRADAAHARLEADRAEIAQGRTALSSDEAAVEQRRHELERAQTELDARAASVGEREAACRAADERLQAEREALETQRRQWESDQASLTAQRDSLTNRERDLEAQEARLAAAREELAREQAEQERVKAELHEQAEQIAEARAALEEARQEFQAECRQIDAARAELAQLRSDLELCREDSLAARRSIEVERELLETTRTQVAAERAAVEAQAQELAERQSLTDRTESDLLRLHEERAAIAELQAAAQRARYDVQHERESVERLRASVERERSEVRSERQALADERARWDARQSEWNADSARLVEEQARLAEERAEWRRQRDASQADRAALAARCDALQAERDQLAESLRDAEAQRDALAAGPVRVDEPSHSADAHGELREQQAALERDWERLRVDREFLEEARGALEAEREQIAAARMQADVELAAQRAQEDRDVVERQQQACEREQLVAEWAQLEAARQALAAERDDLDRRLGELSLTGQQDDSSFGTQAADDSAAVAVPPARDAGNEAFGREYGPDAGAGMGYGNVSAPAFVSEMSAPEEFVDEDPACEEAPAPDAIADDSPAIQGNAPIDEANTPTWIVEPGQLADIADRAADPAFGHGGYGDAEAVAAHGTPIAEDTEFTATAPAAPATESGGDAPATVKALRSRLAEMFGLSPDAAFGHSRPAGDEAAQVSTEEPSSDEPVAVVADDVEDVAQPEPDARATAASEPGSPGMPAQAAGSTPALQPAGDDSHADSVSAYMERLLARSRTAVGGSAPTAAEPVRRRRSSTESSDTVDAPQKSAAAPVPAPPQLEMPSAPPKSIAPEEKEALRANIDSFRELANASARSAVAKHESKKLRTMVQIKVVLTIVAAALTVVLFIANSLGRVSYGVYVLAAGVASIVMAFDLARTILAFYRWKSVETANLWEGDEEPSGEEPAENGEATSVADDNTTSDLPIVPQTAASTAPPTAEVEPTSGDEPEATE